MNKPKDIIIGAGLSGLACGKALKEALIVEKNSEIGGLCRTVTFGKFKFDLGGHRFFTKNKEIGQFIKSLLGDDLLVTKRISKIYRKNKTIDYPLNLSVIFSLNLFESLACLLTYLQRKQHPLKADSFREAVKNRFGDKLYKLFFKNYSEKVWGLPCEELSRELAEARLQNISLKRVIKHILFRRHNNVASFAQELIYPRLGIAMIAEKLSEGLGVRLNSAVTGLICSKKRITKVIINNCQELDCNNLISTMPITKLVTMLNPPDEIQEFSNKLKFRGLICVFLSLDKAKYSNNHWIYFPEKQFFGRLHEPKNWSSDMAPDNKTGICLEIFCQPGDSFWNMPDHQLVEQVVKDLPDSSKFKVEGYCVKRLSYAYPIYDLNYAKNLEKIRQFLDGFENLFILGRSGSFRYINMDSCIEKGLNLGKSLVRLDKKSQQAIPLS